MRLLLLTVEYICHQFKPGFECHRNIPLKRQWLYLHWYTLRGYRLEHLDCGSRERWKKKTICFSCHSFVGEYLAYIWDDIKLLNVT